MSQLWLLLGRASLAFLTILSGLGRLGNYDAAGQTLEALGVPPALLPALIAVEVGGGLLVLGGAFTRCAAAVLAAVSLGTGLAFHGDFNDQNQFIQLSKQVALAGGFLMLAAKGAGDLSVDAWRRQPELPPDDCVICG